MPAFDGSAGAVVQGTENREKAGEKETENLSAIRAKTERKPM